MKTMILVEKFCFICAGNKGMMEKTRLTFGSTQYLSIAPLTIGQQYYTGGHA